ncbi:hypothetical protein OH76DRAFT_1416828 [Lentinus brumalis]|uniref:Plastocyanin-like domain-containing protein n=1 Tax=Lentinus brumalis TaxID=2498619 RepID=A0A371DID0_9APHY|nr:hypothetical protein OH76DRAFT_1416828 [Polyporus brumalis]
MKVFSVLAAAALLAGSSVSAAPAPAEEKFPLIMETNFHLNQCAHIEVTWIGGTPGYNLVRRMYLNEGDRVTWFDAPNPFSWHVIVSEGTVVRWDVQDSVGRSSSSIPVIVGPVGPGSDNCTLIA